MNVQWVTQTAEPVTVGESTVTPRFRKLVVQWREGGLVWQKPTDLLHERGGQTERCRIIDVTRLAQAGLVFGALATAVIMLVGRGKEQAQ